jgi:galactosylceramidase
MRHKLKSLFLTTLLTVMPFCLCGQTIILNPKTAKNTFDGIGVVNGGGATSVLLKDYKEPQRSQILDMVYKSMFGASVSALLVEIPGDGNSTQGSMPSHMHYRHDFNAHRGYTWWILREAKRRNPALTLDATAWSAPHWIGNGNFWSQDAADYYVSWLQILRHVYGLELDALGCRNERGDDYPFVKLLRKTLNGSGFSNVKVHAFDNWYDGKLNFVKDMMKDSALAASIDIISGHTFGMGFPVKAEERAMARQLGKPIWNTEDHVYLKGFDCLITTVNCFNRNYIDNGVTKVVNWYDIGGLYPMEPYSADPPMLLAYEPWSGHYRVRQSLWGYAHYGQFTAAGWKYVDSGCRHLNGGGTMVTLLSPKGDYSVIIETKGARDVQTVSWRTKGTMSRGALCQWTSDSTEQFVRRNDIKPHGGRFTVTLRPNTVYSFSTTRGQQKGCFADIPSSKPFPMPYEDDFEGYKPYYRWGFLPHYFADIIGAFELTGSPDGIGTCLRQTVGEPANSWAPDWNYYTIIGDSAWRDYEVSADVWLNPGDKAAVMGRVFDVGFGWGVIPKGYYLTMDDGGNCAIVVTRGKVDKTELVGDAEQQAIIKSGIDTGVGGELVLAKAHVDGVSPCTWHNLCLRFEGKKITAVVDGKEAMTATSSYAGHGMAGLMAVKDSSRVSTPYFDNIDIRPIKGNDTVSSRPGIEPLY